MSSNVQPETRINWGEVERLARRTGTVAPADPPKAVRGSDPAPRGLLTHPEDPRERLTEYLDAWAGMDEAAWPEANVKALFDDIMDIFREHSEAGTWFEQWRAGHPEAKLC